MIIRSVYQSRCYEILWIIFIRNSNYNFIPLYLTRFRTDILTLYTTSIWRTIFLLPSQRLPVLRGITFSFFSRLKILYTFSIKLVIFLLWRRITYILELCRISFGKCFCVFLLNIIWCFYRLNVMIIYCATSTPSRYWF